MKLDLDETVLMPNAIRTVIPRIIQQYKSYCESITFQPASDSTLFKILNVCSASRQKSMKGLDYIATDGAEAFENLTDVADRLVQAGDADDIWKKEMEEKLKASRRYVKVDYTSHVSTADKCADHCMTFALSDIQSTEFNIKCDHDHLQTCERCDGLENVLKEIHTKIQEGQQADDTKCRIEHEFQKCEADIKSWKAHLLRTANQEIGKQTALQQLQHDGVLIVMDWAMKYMPQKFREKMTDFFGKRGISWHVSAVISRKDGLDDFDVQCYVHIFDHVTQDWFAVASILENVLQVIKENNQDICRVYLRSDNAGCYHNAYLISSLPDIGRRTGLQILRYDFSEVQSGKDICDRKIGTMKSHINHWINEKNDVTTAEQLKQALDSHGGIVGCRIAVCKVNEQRKNAENIKLDGISYFHNFEFNYWEVCVWKAYSIGVGKVITISTMAERL